MIGNIETQEERALALLDRANRRGEERREKTIKPPHIRQTNIGIADGWSVEKFNALKLCAVLKA